MQPILALSGSNLTQDTPFSCAVTTAAGTHSHRSPANERGDLATLVATACRAAAVRPEDLRELRVDLGPGSYTGLRVALTFARCLQDFGELRALGVDSLALLAAAAGPQPPTRRVYAVLDARRERWHRGQLQWQADGTLRHLAPSLALPWADLAAELQPNDLLVVPACLAVRMPAQLGESDRAIECHGVARLTAEALLDERLPFESCTPAQLEPRYLMGSYVDS